MPRLTVKALSEFAERPIADQMRILAEQKRPAAGAAQFKSHYYNPTRQAIRLHYLRGSVPSTIRQAIADVLAGPGPEHKRQHNARAMRAFHGNAALVSRSLRPARPVTHSTAAHGVDVRLHPDLECHDGTCTKFVLFNYTQAPIEDSLARRTLELMYWLLARTGIALAPDDCEFIDLQTGLTHTNSRAPRVTVIKNAEQNLRAIAHLWPII